MSLIYGVNAAVKRGQNQTRLKFAEREQYRTIYGAKVMILLPITKYFYLFIVKLSISP